LKASNFEEQLMLHQDMTGRVYHFDYLVHAHECSTTTSNASKFKSQVVTYKSVNGPKPILQKAVLTTDNPAQSQSFLVKYWYIFVPLMLFVLLAPAEEEKK
jgi:endo-alpha-1,4-polygalactosaminidase (GH114 family)